MSVPEQSETLGPLNGNIINDYTEEEKQALLRPRQGERGRVLGKNGTLSIYMEGGGHRSGIAPPPGQVFEWLNQPKKPIQL